ncbi:MAG: choice-of-anchor D domain-containing protein [Lutimonas sp.]
MRKVHLFSIVFLYSCFSWSQKELIALQGFETSGSSWEPLSFSVSPCASGDDLWNIVDSIGDITPIEGSYFWGIQDLNGDCGSNGFEYIELPGVDISGYRSVTCRINVQVIGFDSGDDIQLEPWFDGMAQDRIVLIDGISNLSTDGWIEAEIEVPDAASEFGLRIYVKQNGTDQAGIDNIRLEGTPLVSCSELFISEYVEGTSSASHRNNFIEIYNPSGEIVSLSGYELVKYTGSNLETSSPLALEGELQPYRTYLVEDQNENLGVNADLSTGSSVLDFNGDDKIGLQKDGLLVDLIGVIGDSLDFGKDQVLRRKSHVQNPARQYNANEWDVYDLEQIANLGGHQSSCSGASPEITVLGNGLEISDGKSNSEFTDNTYFGYLEVGSLDQIENEFVIVNLGTSPLELTQIELIGEHASDFSLGSFTPRSLSAEESLAINVSFSPSAPGIRNAYLRIENNDPSEPNHEFLIQGEGTSYTSSPLMISTYYEGEANNRWIEVTNISAEATEAGGFYLALFRQDLLNGPVGKPPSVKRAIPALDPGQALKFRASLNVSQPTYALDGSEISTGVCGFNGDDVLVISTSDDETCWENRLDIIGRNGPWGQDIAYVRKFGCEQENPHSGFHPEHWYPFGPNEINTAQAGHPQRLGEYYRGETRFRGNTWTNGAPSLYRRAILEDDFNTASHGGLRACSLEIASGSGLVVESGDHIVIRDDLEVQGTLEIMNQGEMLMIENSGRILGNGDIRIHKSSSELTPFDYTYWSSPVDSVEFATTFQGSNPNHIYSFSASLFSDEDGDDQDDDGNAWVRETGNMIPGKGYAIIAPEVLPIDNRQKVIFNGKPNNGLVEIPILLQGTQNSDSDWNLIGNPYPSSLDAEALIGDPLNSGLLNGTIYFWTHNTPLQFDEDTGQKEYSSSDYAIYTIGMGGVQASSGGPVPDGNIASGQSFFTEALAAGTLRFTNDMRRVGLPSHFFKPARNKEPKEEKKVWLNLSSENGAFSQILVGFKEGATPDFDAYYDGMRLSANTHIELYSKLGSRKLAIRGEPPLEGQENIPLGIEVKSDGVESLKIEIDHLTASLDEQGIYLYDREKGLLHNLKKGPCLLGIREKGTVEERFELRFQDQDDPELSSDEGQETPNSEIPDKIIWSLRSETLNVRTRSNSEILDLKLYDMLGRTLLSVQPYEKTVHVPGLSIAHNAVYFLQVSTKNRGVLTSKILHLQP